MTQTQLAAATLDVEQPSLVGLLDALEKGGYITRQPDEPSAHQTGVL